MVFQQYFLWVDGGYCENAALKANLSHSLMCYAKYDTPEHVAHEGYD